MDLTDGRPGWWARGLLFENCNCQLVCPGHVHFTQLCTYERCRGYWAIRIDEGAFGALPLAGLKALIIYDTPQRMSDGGWTEKLIVDETASPSQREVLEHIFFGRAGGPWELLARFVSRRLETKFLPIELIDEGPVKRISISGLLQAAIKQIRGRDRSRPVMFENIFNQIHAPSQVLATGETEYNDGTVVIRNERSHGLYSTFDWFVPPVDPLRNTKPVVFSHP